MSNKNLIIFDTDMDTDCDDAGAFAMLLEAHLQNKIELIGVIADSVSPYAAPCCEVIAEYYGVHVPFGTVFSDDYFDTESNIERFADYRRHSKNCMEQGRGYNYAFAKEINKTDKDYPAAVSIYRKLLSDAEDKSVTVLCVGMLTAIAEALNSEADEISPLSGIELFSRKVKRVITMGNPEKINDFNWGKDALAAECFFELCPCEILISAEGTGIVTGEHLSSGLDCEHPLRKAYEIWLGGPNRGRNSWDLVAALYAIDSDTSLLYYENLGDGFYSAAEKRFYKINEGNRNIKQILLSCEPQKMAEVLNDCMSGNFYI